MDGGVFRADSGERAAVFRVLEGSQRICAQNIDIA